MDENSCEGETSKDLEKTTDGKSSDKDQNIVDDIFKETNPVKVNVDDTAGRSDIAMSEYNEAGAGTLPEPSVSFEPAAPKCESVNVNSEELSSVSQRNIVLDCPVVSQSVNETEEARPLGLVAPVVGQPKMRRPSIGPPPSYSFVMKQKRKGSKPSSPSDFGITSRPPPPPTYNGVCVSSPETEGLGRICIIPSYSEPRWRSRSQPAICPRCGILVFTTTHTHDSVATHMAALALCLFGCWPCCFLPYCLSACKNTYHHCPFCQSFLGSYTPW